MGLHLQYTSRVIKSRLGAVSGGIGAIASSVSLVDVVLVLACFLNGRWSLVHTGRYVTLWYPFLCTKEIREKSPLPDL